MLEKANQEDWYEKIKECSTHPDKVNNSHQYYQTMKEQDAPRESELKYLGHCKMWVRIGEGLPKQVALLRKTGMLITDDQKGLKRWAGRMDFAGVFLCDSDQGNKLLRDMENPEHNAFQPDRAITEEHKNKCRKALNELVSWVRKSVDELAKPQETDGTQIDELNEFFPDIDPPETIPGDEGERDIEGRPIYSPKPLKRQKQKSDTWEDQEDEDGGANEIRDGNIDNSNTPSDGSGEGDGAGGTGTKKFTQSVEIQNARVVSCATDDTKKTVYFNPMKSGKIDIVLDIIGDDGSKERIAVLSSISAKRGKRISLTAILDEPVSDSIMVRAFREAEEDINDENITE